MSVLEVKGIGKSFGSLEVLKNIEFSDDEFTLTTTQGEIKADYVINAAGVHSGKNRKTYW